MMVHRLILISDPFSQDILLITGSVLFFGEQVTPMQVFGEFFGFLSLLSFWLESCRFFLSDFSSLFFSSFIIALLLKFLCSHTPLIGFAIRALGEGRRHIARLVNKPSMTLGLPLLLRFPTVIPSSIFFSPRFAYFYC